MENQYSPPGSTVDDISRSGSGGVTGGMLDAMRGTKPWVLLIGIVLIIASVFMVLGTFGIFIASSTGMGGAGAGAMLGVAVLYGLISLVYIMLAVYLLKYNSAIGRLIQSGSPDNMEDALHSQRKFWKLAGIMTLVMIVLSILGFVAAILIPLAGRH